MQVEREVESTTGPNVAVVRSKTHRDLQRAAGRMCWWPIIWNPSSVTTRLTSRLSVPSGHSRNVVHKTSLGYS